VQEKVSQLESSRRGGRKSFFVQWVRLQKQSARLRRIVRTSKGSHLADLLQLTTSLFYVKSLFSNARVRRYLSNYHLPALQSLESFVETIQQRIDEPGVEMRDPVWTVAKARAALDQLLEAALKNGPQVINIKGKPSVMVVSVKTWKIVNHNDEATHVPKNRLRRKRSQKSQKS
jgi:prevent-host-death family protein